MEVFFVILIYVLSKLRNRADSLESPRSTSVLSHTA